MGLADRRLHVADFQELRLRLVGGVSRRNPGAEHQECATEIQQCGIDPECAAYLNCLDGCTVAADGNVDPGCEQSCPRGSGTVAQDAIRAVSICRTSGPAASCDPCKEQGAGGGNPILNQSCQPSQNPDPCTQCTDEHCCNSSATYHATPEAVAYRDCIVACLDAHGSNCSLDCYEQHPDGIAAFVPLLACSMVYCADGAACGAGPVDPCVACIIEHCAEVYVAYLSDPAGYLHEECYAQCPSQDTACWAQCDADYPSAVPLHQAFAACSLNNCSAECG